VREVGQEIGLGPADFRSVAPLEPGRNQFISTSSSSIFFEISSARPGVGSFSHLNPVARNPRSIGRQPELVMRGRGLPEPSRRLADPPRLAVVASHRPYQQSH
jgi:hypothetical protein